MPTLPLSGYSVAVGEFSGDGTEGESIKQGAYPHVSQLARDNRPDR